MTTQEAIDLAATGWWKIATPEEIVRKQLYEPLCIMDFGDFHLAVEKALGTPVWSHEFGIPAAVEDMKRAFEAKYDTKG